MITTEVDLVRFAGNDSATVFPYAFQVDVATHLVVVLAVTATGVETLLVAGVDYTVTGIGSGLETGGNVTYPIAGDPLATGETLTIYRDHPLLQAVDLLSQGPYNAETQEDALDTLVMQVQTLQAQLNRAFLVPVSSGDAPAEDTFTDLWDGTNLYLNKANYPANYITMDAATGAYVFYKAGAEVFRI